MNEEEKKFYPFSISFDEEKIKNRRNLKNEYDFESILALFGGNDSPDAGPFPAQFGKFGVAQQPRRVRTVFGMRQIEQMFPDRLLKRRSEKPHILPLHRLGHFKNFFRGLFRTRYFRYGIRRHP